MRFDLDILRKCWFLAGPTACGKSEVSVELASQIGAEIVSLDSMALYRGMDIGTATPSRVLCDRVPHHLIDVIDPHEECTVVEYIEASERTCREILARQRVPLFVGGTGLYLRSLLRGVFVGPPADWEFRRRMDEEAASRGTGVLHHKLNEVDPVSAAALHPNDARRVIRALEVYHLTGIPLSQQQKEEPLPVELRPSHVCWLSPPRPWLYDRINRRVEQMIEDGLIAEVQRLLNLSKPLSRTAHQALGYKEVIEALERGKSAEIVGTALEELIELIQTRTRQFAKRQFTWFRNLVECDAISMTGCETTSELANSVINHRPH